MVFKSSCFKLDKSLNLFYAFADLTQIGKWFLRIKNFHVNQWLLIFKMTSNSKFLDYLFIEILSPKSAF